MQRGWVRLWRKTEDSGLLQDPKTCALFLYLLLNAELRPRKIMVKRSAISLKRGDAYIKGRRSLAAYLKQSEQNIRTGLATLENMGILTQQSTQLGTVVSIVNFNVYQHTHNESNPPTNPYLTRISPTSNPPKRVSANKLIELQALKNLKNVRTEEEASTKENP